jgi:hypothetical protein
MRNLSLLGSEAAAGPVKGGPAGPSAASREAASLTGGWREATPFRRPDPARPIGRGRSSQDLRTAQDAPACNPSVAAWWYLSGARLRRR